jgi:glycosyltransferase involved in cell wall biosynthesis
MSYLVSIMMPAYNAEKTIEKALRSLFYQTYENWECIVIDDGSTDNTLDTVNKFSLVDNRIKIFSFEENKGRGAARQFALQQCNGDFIAMLDADDWYYHDKLEKQIQYFIEHPEVDLVSCGMVIQKNDTCIGVRGVSDGEVYSFNAPSPVPVPHASSMFKSNIIQSHTYDLDFKLGQDMDFLRRILIGKKYAKLNYAGYVYDEYISNNPEKIEKSYQYSAKGYLKFLKTYPIVSLKYAILEYIKLVRLKIYVKTIGFEALLEKRSTDINSLQKEQFSKNLEMLKDYE